MWRKTDVCTNVTLHIHAALPRRSTDGLLLSFLSEERVKCATVKVKRRRRVTAPDISITILIPPDLPLEPFVNGLISPVDSGRVNLERGPTCLQTKVKHKYAAHHNNLTGLTPKRSHLMWFQDLSFLLRPAHVLPGSVQFFSGSM